MLELVQDTLSFSFPEVHPDANLGIVFQRTLRIPDDGKTYPLPPGLGRFPVRHVDDFKDRVPASWIEHGGVMLPMFQSEALWINFHSRNIFRQGGYPFAIKVATGKVSAVTGDDWTEGLKDKDYLVVPPQPWLDGYVVEDGLVRQFVAAPLGAGFTTEEQITNKAQFGGIQIEVFPMKREAFEKYFPPKPEVRLSGDLPFMEISVASSIAISTPDSGMGLAAGGTMKQQIFEDPYPMEDWDLARSSRCFVHLANSMVWKAITQQDPPHPPPTADDYTRHGFPWYDYYRDDIKSLAGTGKLKTVKSVLQMGFQKGVQILPENQSAEISSNQVVTLKKSPDEVRQGMW